MNKKIKIVIIVIASLLALSVAKNFLFQSILSGTLSRVAHVPVHIGSTSLRFITSSIDLKNIRVQNPGGFKDRLMLDAPRVAIDFDPPALLKGQFHFEEVQLNLKELTVIKNKDGRLNVNAVKPSSTDQNKAKTAKSKKSPSLKIDKLRLTVGRVVYKDYSVGAEPKVQVFDVNINDRIYTNIESPAALVSLIMFETLARTTLSRLSELDISTFKDTASGALSQGLGLVGDGASALEDQAKSILDIFKN